MTRPRVHKNPGASAVPSFKVVCVGDSGVGKTSIIHRYHSNTFDPAYTATVGIDFLSKIVATSSSSSTTSAAAQYAKLQLWDTAGQEKFHSLAPSYMRGAQAVIVVVDLHARKSLDAAGRWLREIDSSARSNCLRVLCGNKCDLVSEGAEPEVTLDMLKAWGKENNFSLVSAKVSAKTGQGVEEMFVKVARMLVRGGPDPNKQHALKLQEAKTVGDEDDCAC